MYGIVAFTETYLNPLTTAVKVIPLSMYSISYKFVSKKCSLNDDEVIV
jgi:hypothetical protein